MKLHINYTVMKVKKYIPNFFWWPIARVGSVILGIYNMTIPNGWLRSAITGRAVRADGSALPWLSYPVIEWLENHVRPGDTVLECGGGQSTIYFLEKGCVVYCIEPDKKWREEIRKKLRAVHYLYLHFVDTLDELPKSIYWDIILVDLNPMGHYLEKLLEYNTVYNYLIVDNTEITDPSVEYKNSFLKSINTYSSRVDLIGFAPGNACQQSTTIFGISPEANPYNPRIHLTQYKFNG